MTREIVATPDAPKAIGIYSQGVRVGQHRLSVGAGRPRSGHGQLVPGDVEAQVRRVFDNLKAVAQSAGCTSQ